LQTIREVGDGGALARAIDRAFPGARLEIEHPRSEPDAAFPRDRFALFLKMSEFRRPFAARELSDGTLHYLALLAALLTPRPPGLIAVNEPESSIHPDLIEPLAELIARASEHSQVWITTHSTALASAVERLTGSPPIVLEKVEGATRVVGRGVRG
jgi:predicted ATPase